MKATVVLSGNKEALMRRAGEVNPLLEASAQFLTEVSCWILHEGDPVMPGLPVSLSKVLEIRVPSSVPSETLLDILTKTAGEEEINPGDHLFLFPPDSLGEELATRLAFRLQGNSCLQAEALQAGETGIEVARPCYGSHMKAVIEPGKGPWCLTPAKTPAPPAKEITPGCPVIQRKGGIPSLPPWIKGQVEIPDKPADSLAGADRLLVLGNGTGSRKNYENFIPLAKALGARLAASRPAVMSGWAPMSSLVGVSGAVVSPSLCIAAGVSGTAVFSVGIRSSDCIVAINTDPDAPIFNTADIGIVDDMHGVLNALEILLTQKKENNS